MISIRIIGLKQLTALALTISLLSFSSCVSRKSSAYFQNEVSGSFPGFEPVLQVDDLLSIHVSAQNPELYDMFNPFTTKQGTTSSGKSDTGGGYLIDAKGFIEFPLIGKVKLGNLKKEEAILLLKEKLGVYLKDPIITLNIQNYRITVLGDVRSPGSFIVAGEKINFTEALGLAGDLNITAVRNNVLLIRNNNGQKKTFRIDLTKQDFMLSPELYYLRQGDIIYVEPNRSQRNAGAINSKLSIVFSIATVVLTALTLLTRL